MEEYLPSLMIGGLTGVLEAYARYDIVMNSFRNAKESLATILGSKPFDPENPPVCEDLDIHISDRTWFRLILPPIELIFSSTVFLLIRSLETKNQSLENLYHFFLGYTLIRITEILILNTVLKHNDRINKP